MNNNELLKIIITDKDLNKIKPIWKSKDGKEYPHCFSASGMLIDELAYVSKQWTSEELWENNIGYEPYEPYNYNYEQDLFDQVKKVSDYIRICKHIKVKTMLNHNYKDKLQAGAFIALNYPEYWEELLGTYTEYLRDERTDGISKAYNEALQSDLDSWNDDQYREWLYGDHRDYAGVIVEIQKYFEAEDVAYDKEDTSTFVFFFDKEQAKNTLENYNGEKLTIKNYTSYLLGEILEAGQARESKDKQESEKRKAEREKTQAYKQERATQAEAERKAKLLSMTNKR